MIAVRLNPIRTSVVRVCSFVKLDIIERSGIENDDTVGCLLARAAPGGPWMHVTSYGAIRIIRLDNGAESIRDSAPRARFPAGRRINISVVAAARELSFVIRALGNDIIDLMRPMITSRRDGHEIVRYRAAAIGHVLQ